MKPKNRKGSTLILTLIIFSVFMILSTFTLGFMLNENKRSIRHENKTKAYYIARSGAMAVEAAIIDMNEEDIYILEENLPVEEVNIDTEGLIEGLKEDDENITVRVSLKKDEEEDDKLIITSTGMVNDVENKVVRVLMASNSPTSEDSDIPYAIYSSGNMDVKKGTIIGDIASGGNIKLDKDFNLEGNVFPKIENYTPPALPVFPKFPPMPNYPNEDWVSMPKKEGNTYTIDASENEVNIRIKGDLEIKKDSIIEIIGKNKVNIYIEEDFEIKDKSTLTINSESAEANFFIYDEFEIKDESTLIINSGSAEVNFFIYDEFEIKDKSTIRIKDKPSNANFYIKDNEVEIGEGASMEGNIYIDAQGEEDIEFELGKNSVLTGNIYIKGEYDEIEFEGGGTINGLIHAPESKIEFDDGIRINGAVIGKKIEIDDSEVKITYDPKYLDSTGTVSPDLPGTGGKKYNHRFFQ